jgi:hypothetical protein
MYSSIPLETVVVSSNIIDGIATVNINCKFVNLNKFSVNPIHYFSLDYNATIHNLSMTVGDRVLTSVIKKKEQAKQEYNIAVTSGVKASLIEKISDSEYKLYVGNVNAEEHVQVDIEYVTTLECDENGGYVFAFPTNIAVKYLSGSGATKNDIEFQNEISKMKYSTNHLPYDYVFRLEWTSANVITGFDASTEICDVDFVDNKLILTSKSTPMMGDFTVSVKTEHKPCVYYYEDHESNDIYTLTVLRVDKPAETLETERLRKDYNIIIDCSGSMQESFNGKSKMDVTRETIKSFISKLNPDDYFNITMFGSSYRTMLPASIKATTEAIYCANAVLDNMSANMGGTELFSCMNDSICYNQNINDESCEKIIILITDGQIGNYTGLTNMIEKYYEFCNTFIRAQNLSSPTNSTTINNRFRVFTIGVGNDVDRKLIKKIADITGGLYVYAKDTRRLENMLNYIVTNVNARYYTNARLDDGTNSTKTHSALYPNKNYIFIKKIPFGMKLQLEQEGISLLCTNSKTNAPIRCSVKFDKFVLKGREIRQLYHNIVVKSLEHALEFGELSHTDHLNAVSKIVSVSIEEHIMSKYTSFLIVDDVKTTVNTNQSVDITIPHYTSNHTSYPAPASASAYGPRCEEIDALEGGMDMFGGGGGSSGGYYVGEKGFIKHNTEITLDTLQQLLSVKDCEGLCLAHYTSICNAAADVLISNAELTNCDSATYVNVVIFFELAKYEQYTGTRFELLCAIIKHCPTLTSFKMFKIHNHQTKYIETLRSENSRREYKYVSTCSYGGGGDY